MRNLVRALFLALAFTACGRLEAQSGASDAVAPGAADAFAWLEPAHDPAAMAWAEKQTEAALKRIEALPVFAEVRREITTIQAASSPPPAYYILGKRLLRFVRNSEHPRGIFEVAPSDGAQSPQWRPILDVAAYNEQNGTDYQIMFLAPEEQCLPPAFDRCLIPFAAGGSSLIEYREFDLATGTFIKNGFSTPPVRAGVEWLDKDRLAIGHSLGDVPALKSGFPGALYVWQRGTPLAKSKRVFTASPGDSLIGATPTGDGRLVISLARDYKTFEVSLMDKQGRVRRLDLPATLRKFGSPFVVGSKLVFQLAADATIDGRTYAADTLFAYDPDAAAGTHVSVIATPRQGYYINDLYSGAAPLPDGIAFVETHDLRKALVFARPTEAGQWTLTTQLRADAGVALSIRGAVATAGLIAKQSGFLKPTEISVVRSHGSSTPLFEAKPIIDASRFVSEIRSATSEDGTKVDYYIVRPKADSSKPVPTIIAAYGGYGVNLDPDYFSGGLGPSLVPWLERGGAYAIAAVRGGGERGSAWADAARGIHRQKSYDDFAAVAENLIESGYTAPRLIGTFGRSFGGLLSANMAMQRPDLFGASLVGVPIVDLFRLGRDGNDISAGQKIEVGDWDDPAQARLMHAWSPYQNIRSGIHYPRVLTVVSTEDGQVGPGHGRKFTAKLQSVGADALLVEGRTGGHSYPDQFADPDVFAAQMAFFIDALMPGRRSAETD